MTTLTPAAPADAPAGPPGAPVGPAAPAGTPVGPAASVQPSGSVFHDESLVRDREYLEPPRPGPLARLFIGLIRVYQVARRGQPSPCRYLPSCSEYAAIALHRHGAARGSWLTARRLCRCHPWGGYGADPVPEPPRVRNPS